ncbi:MAG TPA: CehA/McbA family metallohydrolase [Thermoplasmata archaeon]|nr:CehA/McbA family metallohydrolase [Thermoplasmata archaeon]
MSDALRLDLHVHSVRSPDSRLTLDAIVERLPHVGMKGFALTDHNSVDGHRELDALRARYPGYLFVPGIEVSTAQGHLLAYGVTETAPAHRPLAETIEWVRAHGGEPVLAHPFRRSHGAGRRLAETAAVAAIESRNGHNSEIANLRAEGVAARRALATTGGSDAHARGEIGRAFTELDPSVGSVDDVLEALRRRRVSAVGASLAWPGRLRLGLRTGLLLASRGFRPI